MPEEAPEEGVTLFRLPVRDEGKEEFYTPREIFDALGLRFDLDVAAPRGGVPWVPADRYLTLEDDGLTAPWEGRVWMNPPFSTTRPWVERFVRHGHGVALLPFNKSDWVTRLWERAEGITVRRPFTFRAPGEEGHSINVAVFFAAFGPECVEALSRIGKVR